MQQTNERRESERRAFMATQPQLIHCHVHPDEQRLIDEHETARRTADNAGMLTAGYIGCPKCLEETKRERFKSYGVPDNLLHATFDNFMPEGDDESSHVAVATDFCNDQRGFLVLLGGYGTGKSHLASAAFQSFKHGWFVKHSSLLLALRATYRDKGAFDPVQRAQAARLLVLDDVGLSSGGRDELPLLHEILDYRHGERLPTIITSNLEWNGLANVIGERMADRLRESTFRILKFSGKSHRRDARERYFNE